VLGIMRNIIYENIDIDIFIISERMGCNGQCAPVSKEAGVYLCAKAQAPNNINVVVALST